MFFSGNHGNDGHKIGIILNLDDVCLVNPLGVRAKTYKYCMIYYNIGEIPQECRSKLSSIFLLACVKTNHVKKYDLRKILEDFIMGIKELENPGIFINNLGWVKGRLLFTTNDNPAAGLLSGTKESAGLSKRTCHTCLITNEDVKRKYKLDPAERQGQAEHLRKCQLIEQATTKTEKSRLSKEYGINERSVLLDLDYINIAMHFMHDVLHVTLEGIFNHHTCNLISYLIDEKIFMYAELNRKLAEYPYSCLDKANRPQVLTKINVEKLSLKQTAITVPLFANILPHITGEKIENFLKNSPMHDVEDHYLNYLNLVNVVILCTSNYIDHDILGNVELLITHYLWGLRHLIPRMDFTPKCHYLQHVPEQLRRFGPSWGTWTLRFVAKHSEFKANNLVNFKNVPKTLAFRCQLMMAYNMLGSDG